MVRPYFFEFLAHVRFLTFDFFLKLVISQMCHLIEHIVLAICCWLLILKGILEHFPSLFYPTKYLEDNYHEGIFTLTLCERNILNVLADF